MKKVFALLAGLTIAITLTSVDLMATSAIAKKHTKPGKGGAKINCKYCHTDAGIPKEKGGVSARSGNPSCSGCHK